MYELHASDFLEAVIITQQAIALAGSPSFPSANKMTKANADSSIESLRRLLTHVSALSVPVTQMAINDSLDALQKGNLTYRGHGQMAINISATLKRELKLKKVFALDPNRADFYAPKEPLFGADVGAKFLAITYDIDQAGKCYACELSTASAFHAIRCMEAGIRAIARSLQIPDPTKGADRSWGKLLRDIDKAIETRWPKSTGRMSGDAQIFDAIYGSLSGIVNPYRNATMHLDQKYTMKEAKHILDVVEGLMTKIASRMDENGLPLA